MGESAPDASHVMKSFTARLIVYVTGSLALLLLAVPAFAQGQDGGQRPDKVPFSTIMIITMVIVVVANIISSASKAKTQQSAEWEKAADNGSRNAQFKIGMAYYMGTAGVVQDYGKAIRWFAGLFKISGSVELIRLPRHLVAHSVQMLRVSNYMRAQRAFLHLFNGPVILIESVHLIFSFTPSICRKIKKDYAG